MFSSSRLSARSKIQLDAAIGVRAAVTFTAVFCHRLPNENRFRVTASFLGMRTGKKKPDASKG